MDALYINDERFSNVRYVGTWEDWKRRMLGANDMSGS
jgi:hypothetical protein